MLNLKSITGNDGTMYPKVSAVSLNLNPFLLNMITIRLKEIPSLIIFIFKMISFTILLSLTFFTVTEKRTTYIGFINRESEKKRISKNRYLLFPWRNQISQWASLKKYKTIFFLYLILNDLYHLNNACVREYVCVCLSVCY